MIFCGAYSRNMGSAPSFGCHCCTAGMPQDVHLDADVTDGAVAKGCPFKLTPVKVNMCISMGC